MQANELDRNNIDIFNRGVNKTPVQDIRDVIHFLNHLLIILGKIIPLPSEKDFFESFELFIESQGRVNGEVSLEFYNMEKI